MLDANSCGIEQALLRQSQGRWLSLSSRASPAKPAQFQPSQLLPRHASPAFPQQPSSAPQITKKSWTTWLCFILGRKTRTRPCLPLSL